MFERFSESARGALFFARYEVSELGGLTIEPEHLALGVLRATPEAIEGFLRAGETGDSLRARVTAALPHLEKTGTSVEIPFSPSALEAIEHTIVEADAANNEWIRPEHLILGVLVKTAGSAASALQDAGVTADAIRAHLRTMRPTPEDEPGVQAMPPPGVISRQWTGVVRPGQADAYLAHLRRETIPALRRLDGFLGVGVLRREVEDGTEFQVTTIWRSLDAIKAFAGEDVTRAVVPPAAQAFMVRFDDRAVHYELVQ